MNPFIVLISFLETVAFVAAVAIAAKYHAWEPATFFLVLSIFFHVQFESLEAARSRELRAKALSEPPAHRRSGLPWASYYLIAIAACGLSSCSPFGLHRSDALRECTLRMKFAGDHAESLAVLDKHPGGGLFIPCAMIFDSLPTKKP